MVTIQVYSQSTGNPVNGSRVSVALGELGGVSTEYTNSSGEAHFPNVSPSDTGYNTEVIVDGKTILKGRLEGRKIIYI
jgi:uncharacterized protein YfaS (alpha-2-macroglobulin family)